MAKGAKMKSENKGDWKRRIAKKNRTQGNGYVYLTSGNRQNYKFVNSCYNKTMSPRISKY